MIVRPRDGASQFLHELLHSSTMRYSSKRKINHSFLLFSSADANLQIPLRGTTLCVCVGVFLTLDESGSSTP